MIIQTFQNCAVYLYKLIYRLLYKYKISIETTIPKKTLDVTIVAIVKNEKKYIQEWIEYHRLLGVEHFFIYDNESTDGLRNFLKKYVDQGIVSYAYIKGSKKQTLCYEDCVARNRNRVKWMAFLDIDEFINIHTKEKISVFLQKYESFSGIGINWICFDCNSHVSEPQEGFVITNFIRRHRNANDYAPNSHIKCIVKPKYILCFMTPHIPKIKNFFHCKRYIVTELFEKISEPVSKIVSTKKIQINHYYSKSKDEYIKKISRGRADTGTIRSPNLVDCFFEGDLIKEPPPIDTNLLKNNIPETYAKKEIRNK